MGIERKEQRFETFIAFTDQVERNLGENERERESKSMTKLGQTDPLPMLIQVHPLQPRYP